MFKIPLRIHSEHLFIHVFVQDFLERDLTPLTLRSGGRGINCTDVRMCRTANEAQRLPGVPKSEVDNDRCEWCASVQIK